MKLPTINYADGSSFLRIDIAGIVICLVLSGAAYLVGARPLMASRDERAERDVAFAATVEQANSLSASTRALRTQLSTAQTALARIEIPLQPSTSINQRIAELTALGGECYLEMQSIQPGAITNSERFAQIPIQVTGTGTYRTCADFLQRLRKQCPDTAVCAFELSVPPGDSSMAVSFNIQLMWYVQPVAGESKR
ncbi:MAG: type 4a pilus biogenesis protein PilO [Anaerolineae bacterium]|nr:type 4a pilus biogenesis protein PilO [Phycisphaerae bacterium]